MGSGAQSSFKLEEEKQQFLKKSKKAWTTASASSSGEKPQSAVLADNSIASVPGACPRA